MGTFNKTAYIHDNAPVYKNQNNQYLYYSSAHVNWRIGSDYIKGVAGVMSVDNSGSICPESVISWKYYGSGKWNQGTLNIECLSNDQIFHAITSYFLTHATCIILLYLIKCTCRFLCTRGQIRY